VLKPYNFAFINKHQKKQFEQQQLVKSITSSDLTDDEKMQHFTTSFKSLADHSIESVALGIESITLPDGQIVADQRFIKEFFNNTDRDTFAKVRKEIIAFGDQAIVKSMKVECTECKKKYEFDLNFNESNFFE